MSTATGAPTVLDATIRLHAMMFCCQEARLPDILIAVVKLRPRQAERGGKEERNYRTRISEKTLFFFFFEILTLHQNRKEMDIDLPLPSLPVILLPTSLHESLAAPKSVKRPRAQDDPFFQEGAYEYNKVAWLCLQTDETYVSHLDDFFFLQRCHQGSCHGQYTFHSMTAYEHHYETNHRYICQSCKKPFPSQKFLDIHLREVHDMLVRIRRERGEKTVSSIFDTPNLLEVKVISSYSLKRVNLGLFWVFVVNSTNASLKAVIAFAPRQ